MLDCCEAAIAIRHLLASEALASSVKTSVHWRQNAAGLSLAAPYCLRAAPTPRASTPVTWDELGAALRSGDASALAFGPADVVARIGSRGDLAARTLCPDPDERSYLP